MQLSAITIVGMLELDLSVWMRIVSADRSSSDMHGGSARRTTVSRYITGARMAAVNTKPARVDCIVGWRRISRSGRKTITMDENGRYELTKPNRAFNTNQVQTILAAWGEGERVGAGAPRVARAEEGARVEARVVTVVRLTANAGRDAKCRA